MQLNHTGKWVDRFVSKIKKDVSGCWLWQGPIDHNGYGVGSSNGGIAFGLFKERAAHRIAWILGKGPIPKGLQVLHHCDVRHCVNYEKCLFLGTNDNNMQDRNQKGRTAKNRGEKHGRSKLTWKQVREIRQSAKFIGKAGNTVKPRKVTYKSLAKKYGVSRSQIWFILSGTNWKD